eukprot:3070077-Rhodomonas_salina.1
MGLFITFQFPVQANLHRNNVCKHHLQWCWCLLRGCSHREMMTHFLCVCPQFDDVRTRARSIFSEGVSAAIEQALAEAWDCHWEKSFRETGLPFMSMEGEG